MRVEQAWGTALLRITLGCIYVAHGYRSYAVQGPAATATHVVAAGYPAAAADVLAWYLILAHVAGGVLLIIGLWARLAALAQVPVIASVVAFVHRDQGFFMRGIAGDRTAGDLVVAGYEFPLLVLVATLAIALLGAGALSFETVRERSGLDRRRR